MFKLWMWLLLLPVLLRTSGLVQDGAPTVWPQENLILTAQVAGDVSSVALAGSYAAIGLGQTVTVLDIAHPTMPVLIGRSLALSAPVVAMTFAAVAPAHVNRRDQPPAFLYLVTGATLSIVDFTDPLSPTLASSLALPAAAEDVAAAAVPTATGSWSVYVYVPVGEAGLRIVDVSDPTQPRETGFYDTPGHAWRVAADLTSVPGQVYAHVTDEHRYYYIVNVTDPDQPLLTASYSGYMGMMQSGDVALAGGYAYIGGDSGMDIMDLSDITQPRRVVGASMVSIGFISRLAAAERRVFVLADSGIVNTINVANPQRPLVSWRYYDTLGEAGEVALAMLPGQETPLAFVACGSRGLQVISGADPTAPMRVGWFNLPGRAYGVSLASQSVCEAGSCTPQVLAYVADHDGSMHIVNVSQPDQPAQMAAYDSTGMAWNVTLDEQIAYVAAGPKGMRIVDVQDLGQPWELSFFQPYDTFIRDVAIAGRYAYAADRMHGRLYSLDMSDPVHPAEIGLFDSPGGAYAVTAVDNLVYLADGAAGLRIVDVSKPDSPFEVGSWQSPGVAVEVAVSGTLAYVAGREEGLHIVDVSNPAQPQLVATYDTPGLVWSVAVDGTSVYLADGPAGVRLLDVSDPARPRETA
ncbi:MAG: hypothetical protein WAV66_11410, partial [Anaerolineae bacterium]